MVATATLATLVVAAAARPVHGVGYRRRILRFHAVRPGSWGERHLGDASGLLRRDSRPARGGASGRERHGDGRPGARPVPRRRRPLGRRGYRRTDCRRDSGGHRRVRGLPHRDGLHCHRRRRRRRPRDGRPARVGRLPGRSSASGSPSPSSAAVSPTSPQKLLRAEQVSESGRRLGAGRPGRAHPGQRRLHRPGTGRRPGIRRWGRRARRRGRPVRPRRHLAGHGRPRRRRAVVRRQRRPRPRASDTSCCARWAGSLLRWREPGRPGYRPAGPAAGERSRFPFSRSWSAAASASPSGRGPARRG